MRVIARLMARGIGSTLPRKNAYPILGKPMLWRFLTEVKKASFIDEIFVWTEDAELTAITRECGCHPIPRTRDQVFAHAGFTRPDEWMRHINAYIDKVSGPGYDILVQLNCNYCLMTAEIMEAMFVRMLEDRIAESIIPVTKVDPHLFMENPKTGCLFPVWQHESLERQDYPDLYRAAGIRITHKRRLTGNESRVLFHQVAPEYLLDVDSLEDVKLAEYYLMLRLGGKIVLPDQPVDVS